MFEERNTGFFASIPTVTKNLVIINLICWFAQVVFAKQGVDLTNLLGLHFFESNHYHLYQFLTYMFMHDPNNITHVIFNMFAVYMFGQTLESVWGSQRFFLYYTLTGVGAGIVQQLAWMFDLRELFANPQMPVNIGTPVVQQSEFFNLMAPTVGASGAVFGILLAFGMLFPNARLMLLFPPIPIKAKWFVIGYGAVELALGVANFSGDNIAHFAHLGGMFFGIILILWWRKTREIE